MATASANRNAGPVSLVPISNKLHGKMNTLREVIDLKKREVLRVSEEMKQLIEDKTQLIIRQLNDIWDQVNTKMYNKREEVNTQIQEINKRKEEMELFFKNLSPTISPIGEIDKAINSIRKEMDIDIPNIRLTWRVDPLTESIQRMCCVQCEESQSNIKYRGDTNFRLKWATCDKGKGDNELWDPWGMAIDSMNERIFVADRNAHRIQIFSLNGDWVKSLKDEKINLPENINFSRNSMFVQCNCAIVRFNRTSFSRESYKCYGFDLSGICTDDTSVYVGVYIGMELIALSYELVEQRNIPLTTPCIQKDSRINNISLAKEEFYILFTKSEYRIQSFSKQGTLIRCIVHIEFLSNNVWHFCLDQQENILVSDRDQNQVKIYSNDGKLITQFGGRGTEKGELSSPKGIAVDDSSNIITLDCKNNNRLQAFSPE